MKPILVFVIVFCIFQTAKLETATLKLCRAQSIPNENEPTTLKISKDYVFEHSSDLNFRLEYSQSANWCEYGSVETFLFPQLNKTDELLKEDATGSATIPLTIDNYLDTSNSTRINGTDKITSKVAYFLPSGTTRIGKEYFQPSEYCVNRPTNGSISLDICVPDCRNPNQPVPCIKKCCSLGRMLNIFDGRCSSSGTKKWTPRVYVTPYSRKPIENNSNPHYIFSPVSCGTELINGRKEPIPFLFYSTAPNKLFQDKVAWKIGADGNLWWNKANEGWLKLENDTYCIDGVMNFGYGEEYRGLLGDEALVLCPGNTPSRQTTVSLLYVVLMYVSSIFLFLTAVVYASLWDLQNVHGWTILSQVISMLFMYLCLATAHLYGIQRTSDNSGGFCVVLGVLSHFFFLSTFCWLTVINVDLYWTFRSLNPAGSGRSKGLKKFLCYLVFALTIPSVVIIVGLTLQDIYGSDIESQVILPRYGVTQCYVAMDAAGAYIYSIVGTLICINVVLILITAVTIFKFKQGTKQATSNRTLPNQSFLLFVKLFIVMGVSWIFEIISWVDLNAKKAKVAPWYWVFFDIVNILQAIAIFVIFVCKRRILKQLKCKYPCLTSILRNPMIPIWNICSKNQEKPSDTEMEPQPGSSSTRISKITDSNSSLTKS